MTLGKRPFQLEQLPEKEEDERETENGEITKLVGRNIALVEGRRAIGSDLCDTRRCFFIFAAISSSPLVSDSNWELKQPLSLLRRWCCCCCCWSCWCCAACQMFDPLWWPSSAASGPHLHHQSTIFICCSTCSLPRLCPHCVQKLVWNDSLDCNRVPNGAKLGNWSMEAVETMSFLASLRWIN